ncbi:CoA-transferase family III domain protein [Acididesulfobacillus acetoxydans]|uniref:CaiB/baiF CoA-transferase protein C7orf10 homolog n=1 Tax=Acididesulfobacillus acetoxydans TaxID=1561005 RepID=A0A8S0WFQ5_9FIRM|nr:CoA transferase [Acididesulfobacillus acetoxydans]CAA7601262.1 CoA-transferase family III domain protein [Acididesulfobacillus acetoxydans]CEJ08459.1 CaiB/baiF CoA-transferase protein C7orf10 homolog [Acididesulfobacillus acetoxydans]
MNPHMPLEGLKVIDCATMMAAPWAATYLADYGAEVLKIEHPKTGDQSRKFGAVKDGVGIFWKTLSRNKKCVTLNLNSGRGKELFLRLVRDADILIENFRPGTLEKWGLGWETLESVNPRLIMLRVTGFGQEGPYASRGGFGTIAEGMSGFASMNGYPDGPPTLPPIPLADGVTGIYAAMAVMMAVYERDVAGSGRGQVIDMSLYEPLMRLMEASIVEHSVLGTVPARVGNRINSAAPRNVYKARDGRWIALSASSQPIAEKVFQAMGRPELIEDPRFRDNPARVQNVEVLDKIIGAWFAERDMQEAVDLLLAAGAVVGPIYDIDQLAGDAQIRARASIIELKDEDFGTVAMPNVVAKFSRTPGAVKFTGPSRGAHNREIYGERLGLSEEELATLKEAGII